MAAIVGACAFVVSHDERLKLSRELLNLERDYCKNAFYSNRLKCKHQLETHLQKCMERLF